MDGPAGCLGGGGVVVEPAQLVCLQFPLRRPHPGKELKVSAAHEPLSSSSAVRVTDLGEHGIRLVVCQEPSLALCAEWRASECQLMGLGL